MDRRPRLEALRFGYGYGYLYESGRTSTGEPIDPLDFHHEGLVQTHMWDALPALRSLDLEGAFLFHSVSHDALTSLRLRGPAISDGSLFGLGSNAALESLEVEIGSDVFGCLCPVEQLDELQPAHFPALRHLDLSEAQFDATTREVLTTLADSPILPQLETLFVYDLLVPDEEDEEQGKEDEEDEDDPSSVPPALAARFAHVDLR